LKALTLTLPIETSKQKNVKIVPWNTTFLVYLR